MNHINLNPDTPIRGNERSAILAILETRRMSNPNLYACDVLLTALIRVVSEIEHRFASEELASIANACETIRECIRTARTRKNEEMRLRRIEEMR